MALRIIPRIVCGRLYFLIGGVFFPTFAQAVSAWSATDCHRLDVVDGGVQ